MLTAPPDSVRVLIDSQSRDPSDDHVASNVRVSKGIPPVCDLDIEETSRLLYYRSDLFNDEDSS